MDEGGGVAEENGQSSSSADDAAVTPDVAEPVADAADPAAVEPESEPSPEPQPEPEPDPEPEPEAAPEPEPQPEPKEVQARVATWPFVAYVASWAVFAAFVVWRLTQIPDGTAVYEFAQYRYMIMAGLALAVCGPALAFLVWIASWNVSEDHGALFISAAVKGSIATFAGVSLWWLALVLVDQARVGRVL